MKRNKSLRTYVSIIVDGGTKYRVDAAGHFRERLSSLCEVVCAIADSRRRIATVLFPAGYFCTPQLARVPKIAKQVIERLDELKPPFAVVWGVDGWTERVKQEAQCSESGYPFFVFARLPSGKRFVQIQQVAVSAAEGRDESLDARWKRRDVLIDWERNALLICGESWSDRLLEKVEKAKPNVLLIPAHRNVNLSGGKSRRSWHLRLKQFNKETGIPVVLSEHSKSPDRHEYTWGGSSLDNLVLPPSVAGQFTAKVIEA